MKVLIACEESGIVRSAFRDLGHDAWSCDLLPSRTPEYHYQEDIFDLLNRETNWDLMIAFPPCTDLACSGAKHFPAKIMDGRQGRAIDFVKKLMDCPIPRIAVENPVGILSTRIRKPDQIVQPWMFGDPYSKRTCLWLKGLPLLVPTNIVDKGAYHITRSGKRIPDWYNLPPNPDRAKIRSTTFPGIARAMADQWGCQLAD